jgi:hypothetical protein
MCSVRVRASNTVGNGVYSPMVLVSTLSLPPPPPVIELQQAGHNSLKIRWTDTKTPAHHDETYSYTVEIQNKVGTFSPVCVLF